MVLGRISMLLLNRVVGSVDGFGYSGSLVAVAETWSAENLDGFLDQTVQIRTRHKDEF